MPAAPVLAAALGFVLGAIVGSFLATVAWRAGQGRSALAGRSACDGCARRLAAGELVPLFGWAWLRGRCRTCGVRIGLLHPAVELCAALIGAAALAVRPDAFGLAGAAFGWALLLLAALDVRLFWLPDRITLPLAACGIAAASLGGPDLSARLIGAAAGFAVLEAVRLLYARVRGRAGLGGGDPKLLAATGAWTGWTALPAVLLAACLLGLVVALVQAARGRGVHATTALPFGALLAPAAYVAWLTQAV